MADIVYTVNQDTPESIAGFEQFSQEDKALVSSFQINNTFDPAKHYSELHILSLADELLESIYAYNSYKLLQNAQSAGQAGTSVLTIDPIADSKAYGYDNGGVKLLYHFLDDLYSEDINPIEFYIQNISPDRTELSLSTLNLTPEVVAASTAKIKANLQSQSYFTGFRLDFKNNDLFIATNIDILDIDAGQVVVVKLYEPLPNTYNLKSTLNIVDVVSDSVAYEIDAQYVIPPTVAPTLRSPNFNIDIADNSVIPTEYFNYNDLFSYPVTNANSQIYSTVSEKGIDINVDYTDFNDFVHFSSAQERLLNFKYKLDLVASYSQSIASGSGATTGLQGISGSRTYYENLITGVVSNFDHYERFLYYESGSTSWPKSNTTKPYINKPSSNAESITWYTNQITSAINYDNTNYNSLVYSIPTYLRDDANNNNYLTFVYMVGQHFDNLWLYSKAVTDKYDADNRMDKGISKDLVAEALKNFGVKLYTSNKSVEDLFTTFIGQAYQSGSEKINHYITGSLTGSNTAIQPTAYDDYQKQVQKRIYHNLPLLLKSKGTERGLRALINCLGIPGDILDIKLYGGRNVNERPFFGDYQYYTSSLDKIRLDNTGSIVSGSTLSNYVSILKRDDKYTDDLHTIEVGFSPTDNIDQYITSHSSAIFNIDNYIGDPRDLTQNNYSGLNYAAKTILSSSLGNSSHYDLQDYVRLIKFFDNTVFKMVKDFIPARAVVDTGIIIKPNLLNRSKANSVNITGSRPEYTASIDTAFIGGTNAGIYKNLSGEYTTAYSELIQTPTSQLNVNFLHGQEQPKYNGELSGSHIVVSTGQLTGNNLFTDTKQGLFLYDVQFVSSSTEICYLNTGSLVYYVTESTAQFNAQYFFNYINTANTIYSQSNNPNTASLQPLSSWPVSFGRYPPYSTIQITAQNTSITSGPRVPCVATASIVYATCSIYIKSPTPSNVQIGLPTDITNWFYSNDQSSNLLQYTVSSSIGIDTLTYTQAQAHTFNQTAGTPVTITINDTGLGGVCTTNFTLVTGVCELGTFTPVPANGFQFLYSNCKNFSSEVGSIYDHQYIQCYLGRTGANTTDYLGIQSYFTPTVQNTATRYSVYGLYKRGGYYHLFREAFTLPDSTTVFCQDINAALWDSGELSQNINHQLYTLPAKQIGTNGPENPVYATYANPYIHDNFPAVGDNPIGFRTAFKEDFIDGFNWAGAGGEDGIAKINKDTLPYAYVIRAYNNDTIGCLQQVTVYGERGVLSPNEGYGNITHFTNTLRYVDWDYEGNSGYNPTNIGDYTAITVPIRSFTQS